MKKLLFFLLLFGWACADRTEPPPVVSQEDLKPGPVDGKIVVENFVQVYMFPEEISLRFWENCIYLNFSGREILQGRRDHLQEFMKLAEKYNDLSYNQSVVPYTNEVIEADIRSIEVVCDRAIGDKHPAGSSLADIMKFCAVTHKPFIDSGYDDSIRWGGNPPDEFVEIGLSEFFGASPICKPLLELEPEDSMLIQPWVCLYFTEVLPAGKYTFTIMVRIGKDDHLTAKMTADVE